MGNQFNKQGGQRFHERFKLGGKLGEGAFSVVKLGHAKKEKFRPVADVPDYAIKIIEKDGLTEEDKIGLEQEISILLEISHPNIINLYEHFDEEDKIYMVTELIMGDELFNRIVKKNRYSELEARDVVKTLLSTMNYLHGKGIVHRDLKPENILLKNAENDLEFKIADFGFAKHSAADSDVNFSLETQCGTPAYMAPEILMNRKYGPPADVWSIGVIVYILLGGYPPFYHAKQNELFKLIKKGKFQFHAKYWSHISHDAKELIRQMLTVDPTARLTCEQLLHHDWMKEHSDTLGARDISTTITELKKWNAKRKLRAAVQAVVAANRIGFGAHHEHSAAEEGLDICKEMVESVEGNEAEKSAIQEIAGELEDELKESEMDSKASEAASEPEKELEE